MDRGHRATAGSSPAQRPTLLLLAAGLVLAGCARTDDGGDGGSTSAPTAAATAVAVDPAPSGSQGQGTPGPDVRPPPEQRPQPGSDPSEEGADGPDAGPGGAVGGGDDPVAALQAGAEQHVPSATAPHASGQDTADRGPAVRLPGAAGREPRTEAEEQGELGEGTGQMVPPGDPASGAGGGEQGGAQRDGAGGDPDEGEDACDEEVPVPGDGCPGSLVVPDAGVLGGCLGAPPGIGAPATHEDQGDQDGPDCGGGSDVMPDRDGGRVPTLPVPVEPPPATPVPVPPVHVPYPEIDPGLRGRLDRVEPSGDRARGRPEGGALGGVGGVGGAP